MNNQRNVGLDLARVIAMAGIVTLHVIGQGGVLKSLNSVRGYWIVLLCEIIAFCSVNVFGLMSGYLGIMKVRGSCYRIVELIVIVLMYSSLISIVYLAFFNYQFESMKDIVTSFIPVVAGKYWYITCYIPIALLQPYINKMLLSLSEKQHQCLCMILFILFSLIPSVTHIDFFKQSMGYSTA